MINRLKEYIEKDEVYQAYKNGKLTNASDFDKFCIEHCKDIEELLEERKEWIKLLNMFKKQQQEFIKYLKKEIVDCKAGSGQQYYAQEHLKMFKEIIGCKDEIN